MGHKSSVVRSTPPSWAYSQGIRRQARHVMRPRGDDVVATMALALFGNNTHKLVCEASEYRCHRHLALCLLAPMATWADDLQDTMP